MKTAEYIFIVGVIPKDLKAHFLVTRVILNYYDNKSVFPDMIPVMLCNQVEEVYLFHYDTVSHYTSLTSKGNTAQSIIINVNTVWMYQGMAD